MNKVNGKPEESFSAPRDLDELETEADESISEYDELITGDQDFEANITEILNQTITKIQSSERGFERKYEKLQEMKDEVWMEEKNQKPKSR